MSGTEPSEISVSQASLERLKAELEELKTKGRAEASEALKVARSHGDLKENAEYDAAKQAQGLMEARIRKLEHVVANSVVIESAEDGSTVSPGMIVEVEDDGETDSYYIAASDEDRIEGFVTVTTSSPMGSAMVGKKVGDKAEYEAPGGTFTVQIVGVRPA